MLLVDSKFQNLPPGDSTIPKDLINPLVKDSELVRNIQLPLITNMDPSIDREAKLNKLLDLIEKIVYILDKTLEKHEDDIDVDYPA